MIGIKCKLGGPHGASLTLGHPPISASRKLQSQQHQSASCRDAWVGSESDGAMTSESTVVCAGLKCEKKDFGAFSPRQRKLQLLLFGKIEVPTWTLWLPFRHQANKSINLFSALGFWRLLSCSRCVVVTLCRCQSAPDISRLSQILIQRIKVARAALTLRRTLEANFTLIFEKGSQTAWLVSLVSERDGSLQYELVQHNSFFWI